MKAGLSLNLYPDTKPAELDHMGNVSEVQLVRDAVGDRKMPAVVLVADVDGKPVQIAMSLRLFRMANIALCARMTEERGEKWYYEEGELNPAGPKL